MAEDITKSTEIKHPARRYVMVGVVMAGLALSACTMQQTPQVEATTSSSQVTSETYSAPTPTEAETSRTPVPTTTDVTLPPAEMREGLAGCLRFSDLATFRNHEYEVCTAYIANSAQIALQGMYKFGNSKVGYLANGARHHFETRYWLEPRADIEQLVDSWPKTSKLAGNKVKQEITLVDLSSNLAADRAVLTTKESWLVTAPNGTVLLYEPLTKKEATMCRGQLPGHPLHEWMVVSNSADPNYDCLGFDKSNGLEP